jgi:hypothetical protein
MSELTPGHKLLGPSLWRKGKIAQEFFRKDNGFVEYAANLADMALACHEK